jgi:hypothetical protein
MIVLPTIAAYRPHVPRNNGYSGTTVAAPNKAAGILNIASEIPPSFRNTATNQNQRAGNSIPLHNVLKTDGGGAAGPT